ncbi:MULTISPECIES: dihydrofolate reductase [unclassified Fusibacter]|uniref:dihydrofolate reductase n=1 Tax=unclassified Fusibacter TaxID=2624464 RepID=UPI00101079D0|nr:MULTISPECIES: dihydrofolate reductase [unclassified Fusibacter]MCK8058304.1 dihydrofolate reductase [Fusibacter sp. A2]NPE20887.1 dihydrofolate reductase [Fusibacter sp. A1]RXV63091.1 dihydrofolate reductase [Fusibacter sp. A1]
MTLSHIVAVSKNGVIGNKNDIPWQIPGELERFKALTMNRTVIMGRKTYESLPKKLIGREIIVVSATLEATKDYRVARSVSQALELTTGLEEVFIAGGGQLYLHTVDLVDRIYYTHVHEHVEGDVTYPLHVLDGFNKVYEEYVKANIDYTYATYERKKEHL